MTRILLISGIGFFLVLLSCSESEKRVEAYSFFVAGHTYGKAGVNNVGFHPPFKKQFDLIKNTDGMSFGVLTGDVVYEPTEKDWQEIDQDIDELGVETHIALGNHEYRDSSMVTMRFKKTYYSFQSGNDLHIILDPNLDRWNISGDQLLFFENEIATSAKSADHIFVYFHQLLWWSPDNGYSHLRPNLKEGRDPELNFWKDIIPPLQASQKPVYLFAGDVGGASWSDDCMYNRFENIHLIASGMGDGLGDNFLIVKVGLDKKVKIGLISLGGKGIDALGTLEEYCHILE